MAGRSLPVAPEALRPPLPGVFALRAIRFSSGLVSRRLLSVIFKGHLRLQGAWL
jgi:hypothetical protein